MAFRNISIALTATDSGLNSIINRAGTTVDQFGRRVQSSGRLVNTTTAGMSHNFSQLDNVISRGVNRSLSGFITTAIGGYAAGRALNNALQAIVGGAVQFDTRMRNVNSLVHLSEGQLHSLGDEVLDLSKKLPQSANTLSEGLYDIESSGFAGTGGLIVLNNAARDASAGLTDTSTSAAAVAGVLNAYGEEAKDAQYVSDSLFQTVNVGVLSFSDLAQGIGQVVGTAAAGKVDIDQLGQAIATMTRAGIVPAEAFTSLNQVLGQIIQPGKQLSQVFNELGYESGAAALQSKGLFGVISDIQSVTGGDVTATSQLFTDIRALRGVLALGTDQGKLYASVVRDWSSAHQGAGATAAAFEEQQKAVSFQWQILKNEARAAAISFGTDVLPDLIRLMHGVEDLGHVISNDGVLHFLELAGAAYALNKAINLGIAIRNSTLASAIERQVAGTISATGAITAEGAAATRTAASLGDLAVAEQAAAVAAGRMAVSGSIEGVAGATANLEGAGTAIGTGMAASMTAGVGRALPALLAGVLRKVAKGGLVALTGELAGGLVGGQTGQAIKDIGIGAGAGVLFGNPLVGAAGGGAFFGTTALLHQFFGDQFGADAPKPSTSLGPAAMAVLQPLINQYGSLATAERVLNEINRETAASQRDLGISHKITTGDMQTELAALQALQKQRADFDKQVSSAFSSSVDVTQQFDPAAGQAAVKAAQQELLDAKKALREEEARVAAQDKASVSSGISLANARDRVTQATQDLAKAQSDAAKTGDLSTIYRHDIDQAHQFVQDVRSAETRNLDPQLIVRLLKEGPEKAGPLLDAIVSDHSNRMIRLANENEQVLRRIGAQELRYAQFVRDATIAPLQDQERLAKELPKALKLDQTLRSMPAPATGQWLAAQLGMTPRQIRQLATDFGITLPKFVQDTLDKHPVHVRVTAPAGISLDNQQRLGYADGGYIQGPGSGTSDSILAKLSNGEFVVRAAAVNYYGPGYFSALNKMTLPRYADGGLVGVQGAGGAVTIVRIVEQPKQYITRHEVNVGEVRAHDYRDFNRQMRAASRRRKLSEV